MFCNTKSSNGMGRESAEWNVVAGTYYLDVIKEWWGTGGDYTFNATFEDSKESFVETIAKNDNSIQSANAIELNKEYKGQIALNDAADVYKFTLPSAGKVTLSATAKIPLIEYDFVSEDGSWNAREKWVWAEGSGYSNRNLVFYLPAGTYYYTVIQQAESDKKSDVGTYSFKVGYEAISESFPETFEKNDNAMDKANTIALSKDYSGMISVNKDVDYYKFTLAKEDNVLVSIKGKGNVDLIFMMQPVRK